MIVTETQDIIPLSEWLNTVDEVELDIETTGLNTRKKAIMGFGISDETTSFYIPIFNWNATKGTLDTVMPMAIVTLILEELKKKKIVTFNGAFDIPFIKNFLGVDLLDSLYIDVLLLKHTVDESYPFKLKEIGAKLFGSSVKDHKAEMQASAKANGGAATDYYKADIEMLGGYCEEDCKLTNKVKKHYMKLLKEQGLEKFFFEEVMALYKEVTIPMEQRGVRLDMPLVTSSKIEIEADIEALENDIQNQISPLLAKFTTWFLNKDYPASRSGAFAQGICEFYKLDLPRTKGGSYSLSAKNIEALPDSLPKSILKKSALIPVDDISKIQNMLWQKTDSKYMFNLSSKHHLKKLFFETLGETPLSRTPKGAPQVDDEFIQSVSEKYDWAAKLTSYNKLVKIRGTYIDRFLEESEDGIFYPSFYQHRTVSGRYGSDLQQLPRPLSEGSADPVVEKHTNRIRKFFIAREGYSFLDADYESLEPHVFAHVSGDEEIKNIFRNGQDFYSTIAIKTEKLEGVSAFKSDPNYLGTIDPVRRQRAKSYSLGIPYGMSGYKLSFELGITPDAAEKLVKDYLAAFPQLHSWMRASELKCTSEGFIRSEAGRIRHMPRAKKLYATHGASILDSLGLYKDYHDQGEALYSRMKELRKELKNYLNNAKNFQIQSLSASIVNRSAIAINRYLKENDVDGLVVCQIHDQLIVEINDKDALLFKEKMQQLMQETYKISLPLQAPAHVSRNFKDGH